MSAPTIPPIPDRIAAGAALGGRKPGWPTAIDPDRPGDPLVALAAYLDPPEPGACIEVDLAAAAAIVAAARQVGHPDLDDTDVAERLPDAVDAYDQATQGRWSR